MKTCRDYLVEYLKALGFDGVYSSEGECGCSLEDFNPCGSPYWDCQPGVRVPCPGEGCEGKDDPDHFHIGPRPEDADGK